MKITIKNYDSYKYREVWKIVEMRCNQVYKTQKIGYCAAGIKVPGFIMGTLSTSLTRKPEFELELLTEEEIKCL